MIKNKYDPLIGYMVNNNRLEIDHANRKDAVMIKPDQQYWWDKLGGYPLKLFDNKSGFRNLDPIQQHIAENYWIPRSKYASYCSLLEKAEIPEEHWDNLILVVHYYEQYRLNEIPNENDHNDAITEMMRFVGVLNKPFDIERISIKVRPYSWLEGEKKEYVIDQANEAARAAVSASRAASEVAKDTAAKAKDSPNSESIAAAKEAKKALHDAVKIAKEAKVEAKNAENNETFKLTEPKVLGDLILMFKKWTKSSEFKHLFLRSTPLEIVLAKPTAARRIRKEDKILLWVFNYLNEKELAKSHQNACLKTGLLLSGYKNLVPSEDDYKKNPKSASSHANYHSYLSDKMRKRIGQAIERRDNEAIVTHS